MSDTPETDAKVWSDHSEGILYEVVEASFARKLERDRDEAREKYDNLATENMLQINKLCNERDEAIAERDIARLSALDSDRAHDRMVGELERIYKERDSLIESSKYWQEMYEAVSTF